ncbi:MAG: hypothetical protein N2235_02625 [Fischerella sp.]|nr:hypothetical protein [Fischerella sp.]
MGNEIRRSQRGNNNAYCQDNEISWVDWFAQERVLSVTYGSHEPHLVWHGVNWDNQIGRAIPIA